MAVKKKPPTTRVLGAQGHSDSDSNQSPRVFSTDNNNDNVTIRVEQGGQNIEMTEHRDGRNGATGQ